MVLTVCPNPAIDTYAFLASLELGKSNRVKSIQEFPGGKGVHVALAIKELGGDTSLKGFWAGSAGEWVINTCREYGLNVTGTEIQGNTRKCFTFITEESISDHTEVLEPGPNLGEEEFYAFKEGFSASLEVADLVCISGSWPIGSPFDACRQLVKIANETGVKVFLDCTGVQLEHALKEKVFGLHLNESEYEEAIRELGKEIFENIPCLALTKGKEGLILKYKGEQVEAKLELKEIISTVGSGDCLTAGICYAIDRGFSIEEIARYGVACGAANCLREELGMMYKSDVERLLGEVGINY